MLLRTFIKSLGRRPTATQRTEILNKRRRLESRITTFEQRLAVLMDVPDDVQWSGAAGKRRTDPESADSVSDDGSTVDAETVFTPEQDMISLPSSLAPGEIERISLHAIAGIEAELRKGQISDALEGLRLALGEKSLCFRGQVRDANSQRTSQRAWSNVHKHDAEARKHRKTYIHARTALQRLSADSDYLSTLQDITDADMKVSSDVTEENRYGQRSDTLAWFWRMDDGLSNEAESSPRMRECMYYLFRPY